MKNIVWVLIVFLFWSCSYSKQDKMNGVSLVASREQASQTVIDPILKIHANYAAVMPFGFIREYESPEILFNTERQWFGERKEGVKQYVELLHKNGIQVMLKPQLWIWRGEFTGRLQMETEAQWKQLEDSYERFILTYAETAQETKVSVFCIGTELEQFVKQRPDFWKNLIAKVKKVYTGKITYAANWDEFPRTHFWKDIDYIGIDAYFPLSQEKVPSIVQLREGWKSHKEKIKNLAEATGKKVIFTEYGYRSMEYTGKQPWIATRDNATISLEGQANATHAIFEEFWEEDWFAGGFVWKWFLDHASSGGSENDRFTPQNKPAEEVLRSFYSKY